MSKTALTTKERVSKQRVRLIITSPFFGTLAMMLRLKEDERGTICQTMATDGTMLIYHPPFVDKLTDEELRGVIAHEVLHCAFRHMFRMGARDPQLSNIACDYAINWILVESGFKLPEGALLDKQWENMEWEEIYERLKQKASKVTLPVHATGEFTAPGALCAGEGKAEVDGEGNIQVYGPIDWELAARQAAQQARMAGRLPAGLERALDIANEPVINWIERMRQFITQTVPSDYCWSTPNKMMLAHGMYLPGVEKNNTPPVVIAVDTSGSMTQQDLDLAGPEIKAILEDALPEKLYVMYCDTEVADVQEFDPGDLLLLMPKGGGGTSFQPVFDKVAEMSIEPCCLVYFTDLENFDQIEQPPYPVMWVTTCKTSKEGEFGETIHLTEHLPD